MTNYFDLPCQSLSLVNGGNLKYYSPTTMEKFQEYVKDLEKSGFKSVCRRTDGGNDFVSLINGEDFVHAYFSQRDSGVRIITEHAPVLPCFEPVKPEKYTVPSVTQLKLDYEHEAFGMSYIITLQDSTFIIIDGGLNGGSYGNDNCEHLWNKLNELNKRPDGKIIINAWLLTHAHPDHYMAMRDFSVQYGDCVEIDMLISNVPPIEFSMGSVTFDPFDGDGSAMKSIANNFTSKPKIYRPHTGQEFYIKNLKFEVMYTFEDYYPDVLTDFNTSGVVLRMTMMDNTLMWAADTRILGGEKMADLWGELLKSDIVQVPHHGFFDGGGERWYGLVGARLALRPAAYWNAWFCYSQSAIVRNWLTQKGNVDIVYADGSDATLLFLYDGCVVDGDNKREYIFDRF